MYSALYRTAAGRLERLWDYRAVAPEALAAALAPGVAGAGDLPRRRSRRPSPPSSSGCWATRPASRRRPSACLRRSPSPISARAALERGDAPTRRRWFRSISAGRRPSSAGSVSVSDLRIEPMRVDDLDAVLAIERAVVHASLVAPGVPLRAAREPSGSTVGGAARAPGGRGPAALIGYLCLWLIADELHVTNFAVDPTHRQRGFGRQLLGTLLELYRRNGARRAALEVRPSNHSARRLYEAFGFRQVGPPQGLLLRHRRGCAPDGGAVPGGRRGDRRRRPPGRVREPGTA